METRGQKDVFQIKYMRSIRTFQNTIGQWPNNAFGSKSVRTKMLLAYRYFLTTLNAVCVSSIIANLRKNFRTVSFLDAGQMYTNILLNLLNLQRMTLPFQKKYGLIVKKFAFEFHLLHHENISKYAVKQRRWIDKLCSIYTRIIQVQLCGGLISYNISPLMVNFQMGMFSRNRPENGTFQHSVEYVLPFDYKHSLPGYIVISIFNLYMSYNVPASMCVYDLLIFLMVFHIMGHLNILSNSLENFLQPSYEMGTREDTVERRREYNERAFVLLKNIIEHYQIVKKFMNEMSEAFDITLCVYLAFFQLMCCICLVECATMDKDAIGKYSVLTIFVFQQLIQTSVIFELINVKSEKLPDQVYSLPWEAMDKDNRRAVLMLLRNVQYPLALKAGGMVPVGVQTMSAIIRTSFSYFLMLSKLGLEMARSVADVDVHAEVEGEEMEDKLDVSVDKIDNGLYLGNLACARDHKMLHELAITHVLTIDLVPLPRSVLRADFVFKFVQLADIPKDDLISHLPECIEFIQNAIDGGGNVLVHCYFGVSRSAAVVIGYIMQRYFLDYDDAFQLVKSQRRFIGPNQGFVAQLKLYGQMGYILNKEDPRYKQFRLKMAGQKLKQVKILPQLFADLVKPDPGLARERPDPVVYRCRKCRRVVAGQRNIIPHVPKLMKIEMAKRGIRPATSKSPALQCAENGQILIQKLKSLACQILDPEGPASSEPEGCEEGPSHLDGHTEHGMVDAHIASRDAAHVCRLMWFVEPMSWMEGVASAPSGKLHCPKCRNKIGSFSWVCGCKCPCGQKVAPAFYLVPSKVEWSNIVQNVQVTV